MLDTKALAQALAPIVREQIKAAIEPLMAQIAALEAREQLLPEKGEPGEPGLPGNDGRDADEALVAELVAGAVGKALPEALAAAVASLPAAEPGKDGEPGKAGEKGDKGDDGIGIADLLIDRDGALVVTLGDGRTKSLGGVVGKDGDNGVDAIAKDGIDGLGFDDLTVEHDGERGFTFKLSQGDRVKEYSFSVPVMLDRGVYKDGGAYEKGDAVSYGGSIWLAQGDTTAKPDGSSDWRLAVKRGRDMTKGTAERAALR